MNFIELERQTVNLEQVATVKRLTWNVGGEPHEGVKVIFSGGGAAWIDDPDGAQLESAILHMAQDAEYAAERQYAQDVRAELHG